MNQRGVLMVTGGWAEVHIRAYQDCQDVELVGLCGHVNRGRLSSLAEQYGIPNRSTDLAELVAIQRGGGLIHLGSGVMAMSSFLSSCAEEVSASNERRETATEAAARKLCHTGLSSRSVREPRGRRLPGKPPVQTTSRNRTGRTPFPAPSRPSACMPISCGASAPWASRTPPPSSSGPSRRPSRVATSSPRP